MTNVDQEFDYFHWGLAPNAADPVYGLYSHALDRFIGVEHDLEVAKKSTVIVFPKLVTQIVDLTTAGNYQPCIIDNTVCENWSATFRGLFDLEKTLSETLQADQLIESPLPQDDRQKIHTAKKWWQMIVFWCRMIEEADRLYNSNIWPETFMSQFLELPNFYPFNECKNKIYKELYIGNDYAETSRTVTELARTDHRLMHTIHNYFGINQ
jgi:hypothetical protein